jgi:hypothetical protein
MERDGGERDEKGREEGVGASGIVYRDCACVRALMYAPL